MNAELPYLKRIADALKRLSANGWGSASSSSSSGTGSSASSASLSGAVNTADINGKVMGALTETETVEEATVTRSIYDVASEEIIATLHDALFVSETQEGVTTEKSVLQAIREDIEAINTSSENTSS